jgi:hypothetical protein
MVGAAVDIYQSISTEMISDAPGMASLSQIATARIAGSERRAAMLGAAWRF